ncbi:NAD(P)/FAD-dependent oxidoreductase [Lacipirellula sp.]|uniref:NAD(P)/FAD-dependent oxidoreductase n=1 Tax=Lacipirellula sp. TaxID=2691419 RepID=UPI003D102E82
MTAINESVRWDVVVVGAGPAGAIAARQLGLQRKRVLLIDKAALPRDKVCGGCLGGSALTLLKGIGLGHIPIACHGVPLSKFELSSGGATARIAIGERIAISRRAFDDALIREAMRAGVVVCDKVQGILQPVTDDKCRNVTLRRVGKEMNVRADVVVVATGLANVPRECVTHSTLHSLIGLGAISDHVPYNFAPGSLHMAYGSAGYVGVTAVERGRFGIAAAIDPSALAAAESPGRLVRKILQASGSMLATDWESLQWQGTPSLTRRTTPIASHRCLLVGDAAAYVQPFTGEGIGWAMQSGALVASLLVGSLSQWDSAIEYRWKQLFDKTIADRHRFCRILCTCMRIKAVRQLAVWGLRQAPCLGEPVMRYLDRPLDRTC